MVLSSNVHSEGMYIHTDNTGVTTHRLNVRDVTKELPPPLETPLFPVRNLPLAIIAMFHLVGTFLQFFKVTNGHSVLAKQRIISPQPPDLLLAGKVAGVTRANIVIDEATTGSRICVQARNDITVGLSPNRSKSSAESQDNAGEATRS